MNDIRRAFYDSLEVHQIRCAGITGFALPVVLEDSGNEYIRHPARGVIRFAEQGVDLSIIQAAFHQIGADGRLGPPVRVPRPRFTYDPGILAELSDAAAADEAMPA